MSAEMLDSPLDAPTEEPADPSLEEQLDAQLDAAASKVQQQPALAASELESIATQAIHAGRHDLAGHATYLAARAFVNVGRLDAALEAIEAARAHFVQAGLVTDAIRTGLGRMHVLDDLGHHDDAIVVGRALLADVAALKGSDGAGDGNDESVASGRGRLAAAAFDNIGVSNGSLGRHQEALDAYDEAEHRYVAAGLDLDAARCRANRGVELLELGRLDAAIEALTAAVPFFLDDGDQLFAGLCSAYLALGHVRVGDFVAAHRFLATSDELLAGAEITTEWARAQLRRAETLRELNLVDGAVELYGQLGARFAASDLQHDQAIATLGLAEVVLRRGERRRAAGLFDAAADQFDAIGDEASAASCSIGRSYTDGAAQRIGSARRAVSVFERLGRSHDEVAARLRCVELGDDDPDLHLRRCAEVLSGQPAPHLEWQMRRHVARAAAADGRSAAAMVELHAAAEVIEQLRRSVTDEASRVPFLGSRRSVHEDLVALFLDDGDVAAAYRLVAAARARTLLEQGADAIDVSDDVASGQPGGGDVTTIVYELIGREVLAFVVAGGEPVVARHLTDVATLAVQTGRLAAQWRRFDSAVAQGAAPDLEATLAINRDLYDLLVAPLGLPDAAAALRIVPVGSMANVSFAAFHDGERYLVERCTLSVSPSPHSVRGPGRELRRCLVVGATDELAPAVQRETEAIAALRHLGQVVVLDGDDATRAAVVDQLADHDLLHIACHGRNRADNPALSALRLADGELTAQEVAAISLDGQLVVLSACSSGKQHATGNVDELLGLPRAFLAAGAAHVVVNLWEVDDAAAADLMTAFHEGLDEWSVAEALAAAQRTMLRARPHPYYWASAVVYTATEQQEMR